MSNSESRTVRLVGAFKLRSPMSHIGEAISTTSYLVQEPILQDDGSVEEVFCYSGNAWRGQLRDLCAQYMLDKLGGARINLDAFHLLFSGGRIGGDQKTDIDASRHLRRSVPMLSVFGGGVGNQILPGKIRVSNSYPLCHEAKPALPNSRHSSCLTSYRQLTIEKSFSRKDDSKDPRLLPRIDTPESLLLEGEPRKKEGPADQMRMTSELLIAGTTLHTEIQCIDMSDVELGALTSAIHRFALSPYIGGQANRGHGMVALHYDIVNEAGEQQPFISIGEKGRLHPPAESAKAAYDAHLLSVYDEMLQNNADSITKLLGVG